MTVTRGTTNGNVRGSSTSRAARRAWLVETYAADVVVLILRDDEGRPLLVDGRPLVIAAAPADASGTDSWDRACRCYRCGVPLTVDTVTVDRIIPGCQGGSYRRDNIRPACGPCNSSTGGRTRRKAGRHRNGNKP